jgi:hypothetical protein
LNLRSEQIHFFFNAKTLQTPITIYRFELDQITLPGPGYMAYDPSVISLVVNPRLLAVLTTICTIIAGAFYLFLRNEGTEK